MLWFSSCLNGADTVCCVGAASGSADTDKKEKAPKGGTAVKVTPVITSSNRAIKVKGYKTGEFLPSDQVMTAPVVSNPHKPLLAELAGGKGCG